MKSFSEVSPLLVGPASMTTGTDPNCLQQQWAGVKYPVVYCQDIRKVFIFTRGAGQSQQTDPGLDFFPSLTVQSPPQCWWGSSSLADHSASLKFLFFWPSSLLLFSCHLCIGSGIMLWNIFSHQTVTCRDDFHALSRLNLWTPLVSP